MNRETLKCVLVTVLFVSGGGGEVLCGQATDAEGSPLQWTAAAVSEREKALQLLGQDGFAVIHNPAEEKIFLNRLEQAGSR